MVSKRKTAAILAAEHAILLTTIAHTMYDLLTQDEINHGHPRLIGMIKACGRVNPELGFNLGAGVKEVVRHIYMDLHAECSLDDLDNPNFNPNKFKDLERWGKLLQFLKYHWNLSTLTPP